MKRKFKPDPHKWAAYRTTLAEYVDRNSECALAEPLSFALCYVRHLQDENRKHEKESMNHTILNGFVAIKAKHNEQMYFGTRQHARHATHCFKPPCPKFTEKMGDRPVELNEFDEESNKFISNLLQARS
jgi:hypothetical protein